MTEYNPYNFERLSKEELVDVIKGCCMADQRARANEALRCLLQDVLEKQVEDKL